MPDNTQIRARYGILPETTVLLYVGRLAREKNLEELLRCQREAQRRHAVLMVVGDGPFRKELEKQAGKYGLSESVIFTGMVPTEEVWKYYQAGDLFVSASTSETQGLTYGEALASGLPLLCRKDGCLEEVVKEGENGWQYSSQDEFLDHLETWNGMNKQGKEQMCRNAEQSAAVFSSERFYRRVIQIYEERTKADAGAA